MQPVGVQPGMPAYGMINSQEMFAGGQPLMMPIQTMQTEGIPN